MDRLERLGIYLSPPDTRARAAIEADIREELETHLAFAAEDNERSGMDALAARRRAENAFGDLERTVAECRAVQLWERVMLQRINVALIAILILIVGTNVVITSGDSSHTSAAVGELREDVAALASALRRAPASAAAVGMDDRFDEMSARLLDIDDRLAKLAVAGPVTGGDPEQISELNERLAGIATKLDSGGVTAAGNRWRDYPDDALVRRAQNLSRGRGSEYEAIGAFQAALARNLDSDLKVEALRGLGDAQRRAGMNPEAIATLRQALELAPRDTEKGQGISHALGWIIGNGGDPAGALAEFDLLRREAGEMTDAIDIAVRNAASVMAERTGDTTRAREELEGLVARYENSDVAYFQNWVKSARKRLQNM